MDIGKNFKTPKKLLLHSKVTLITSAALILVGFVFYFAVEYSRAFDDMNVDILAESPQESPVVA